MLVHIFNSSIVSGPETLVLPALPRLNRPLCVIFLCELRKAVESERTVSYAQSFGLTVHRVWVKSRYDRRAIHELAELLKSVGATIVHAHDVKASTYTLAASRHAVTKGHGFWKLISTHHGVRGRSGLKVKAYEWYYSRFVLPHFDRVLAVCNSDRKLLLAKGLKSERVVAHLNGVDRREVPPQSRSAEHARIQELWGVTRCVDAQNPLVLGFLGRLSPEKRLDRILALAAYLKNEHPHLPPWALLLFGSGPLAEELQIMTRSLGLEKQVFWMGYRAEVRDELAGFDILISMSDAEGLPINLIEAGWGGTPVFATQVDGNLDLIPSEDFGTLVDVNLSDRQIADRLAAMIQDTRGREEKGKAFQQRVKTTFSGERWTQDLESIYRGLQEA